MVKFQLARRGITDLRVLGAMGTVHREAFLAADLAEFAYDDCALAIEAGQTISQPFIVAFMLQAAALNPNDRALEIGTGSGYAATVMSHLCREVATGRSSGRGCGPRKGYSKSGKNPELKAWTALTEPALEHHLAMAR